MSGCFVPFLNEATRVIQAKLLKVSEEGLHSLWMAGRITRQHWDLSQAGQNTQSQNMGTYKECSEHNGRQPGGHCAWMWMLQRPQPPPGPLTCIAFTLCVDMYRNSFI